MYKAITNVFFLTLKDEPEPSGVIDIHIQYTCPNGSVEIGVSFICSKISPIGISNSLVGHVRLYIKYMSGTHFGKYVYNFVHVAIAD